MREGCGLEEPPHDPDNSNGASVSCHPCLFFPRSVWDGSCIILVHVQDVEDEEKADDMAYLQFPLECMFQVIHR
jgi:hypothetical protein